MAELDLKSLLAASFDDPDIGTVRKLRKLSIEVSFVQILLGALIGRAPDLLDNPFLKAVYDALCESGDDEPFNEALKRLQPLLDEFNRQHAQEPTT